MHFEILVEDHSGKKALDILVPKIIGDKHTLKVKEFKGIGRIKPGKKSAKAAKDGLLLDNLPALLRGYGKTWNNYQGVVIVVCDLDSKCLKAFRQELYNLFDACTPRPETRFCIAIEEGEAWFLGDIKAVKTAYPQAKDSVLRSYKNDSICGTWEKLADAVHKGGLLDLQKKPWWAVGAKKAKWAEKITPHMEIRKNKSPSFVYFRDILLELAKKVTNH